MYIIFGFTAAKIRTGYHNRLDLIVEETKQMVKCSSLFFKSKMDLDDLEEYC